MLYSQFPGLQRVHNKYMLALHLHQDQEKPGALNHALLVSGRRPSPEHTAKVT